MNIIGRMAAEVPDKMPSSMEKLTKAMAAPAVQSSLKGFTKTIQISLTDLHEDYLLTVVDGKLSSVEKKSLPTADMTILVTDALMNSVMDKSTNATAEYMKGAIKFKGSMLDLMRLQQVFG
jgi:putative sterol carrier protein